MAKSLVTTGREIQERLEELTHEAEIRNAQLKQQLEELSAKPDSQKAVWSEVQFLDNATIRIGTAKFNRLIRSTAKYDDIASTVAGSTGNECRHFGYRDAQGRLVWIRTNQDVHFMFASFFAEKAAFRQITVLQPEELGSLLNLPLRKEFNFKEGMAVFRVECAGEEAPLIFLSIPSNSSREEALEHFRSIFGGVTRLTIDDPADDRIEIDSDDPWEYCIEAAATVSKAGKYLLLRIETTPPD
jgi:hypothetical protein